MPNDELAKFKISGTDEEKRRKLDALKKALSGQLNIAKKLDAMITEHRADGHDVTACRECAVVECDRDDPRHFDAGGCPACGEGG